MVSSALSVDRLAWAALDWLILASDADGLRIELPSRGR